MVELMTAAGCSLLYSRGVGQS